MNRFMNGILLGVGIGLLVAPVPGEEMRKRIAAQMNQFKAYLPSNEQMDQYKKQISAGVSQATDSMKGYAQQAASTVQVGVKSTADSLNTIAQNAASTLKQTGKDATRAAKIGAAKSS